MLLCFFDCLTSAQLPGLLDLKHPLVSGHTILLLHIEEVPSLSGKLRISMSRENFCSLWKICENYEAFITCTFYLFSAHDSTYVVFHNAIASYAVCTYVYVNRD